MKKLIYTAFVICGMLTASCSDLLNLESKTDVTNNYLFTTPEGLNTVVTGLYSLARELPGGADNNESNLYIVTMCDFNTDIAILRAGVSTSIGRLNTSFTPSTGDVNKFWKYHYGIIGKANEIIVAAEALGLDDSDVLHAWSEAKFFRCSVRPPATGTLYNSVIAPVGNRAVLAGSCIEAEKKTYFPSGVKADGISDAE